MLHIPASDGVKIACYVDDLTDLWVPEEQKEWILLYHGSCETAAIFNPIVATLARHFKVLRMDERGMGRSTVEPGSYKPSTERFMEDVRNVIDALGIDRFHFFAEGSGGICAMSFALAHPERLKTLVLCQTPYRLPRDLVPVYCLGEASIGAAIRKLGFREWQRKVPGYRSFNLDSVDPQLVEWYGDYRAQNSDEASSARTEWAFTIDLQDKVSEIRVPTMLMAATGTYQTPPAVLEFVRKANPGIELHDLPGSHGQAVHVTMPDLVADTATGFIKKWVAASKGSAATSS
jgi:3-oxoadipate enol-lactonase